jgi:hypothetical protein
MVNNYIIFLILAAKLLIILHICKFFCTFAAFFNKIMQSFIYQDTTIAFVTAAAQTCLLIEKCSEYEREEWREQLLRLLPVLYLRTRLLEPAETMQDEEPQRFVTEEDYNYALIGMREMMGQDDAYLDVFVDRGVYTDEVQTAYISEGLADIYQELRDMTAAFQTEQEPVMNDAVVVCREAFDDHWGQKLLAVMRALHAISNTSYQ